MYVNLNDMPIIYSNTLAGVTNVTFMIVNTTYIYLRWDPPQQTNGVITGYTLSIDDPTIPDINILGNEAREINLYSVGRCHKQLTSLFILSIVPGVPYMYSLTASNVFGSSDAYTQMFFTAELSKESLHY